MPNPVSTDRKRLEVLLLCLMAGCYLLPWRMYGYEPPTAPTDNVLVLQREQVTGLRLTYDLARTSVRQWKTGTLTDEGIVYGGPDAWTNTLAALSHVLPLLLFVVALPEAVLLNHRPTITLALTGFGLVVTSAINFAMAVLKSGDIIFRGSGPPGGAVEDASIWGVGPLLVLLFSAVLLALWGAPFLTKLRRAPGTEG
jgi:hypothetical protein